MLIDVTKYHYQNKGQIYNSESYLCGADLEIIDNNNIVKLRLITNSAHRLELSINMPAFIIPVMEMPSYFRWVDFEERRVMVWIIENVSLLITKKQLNEGFEYF